MLARTLYFVLHVLRIFLILIVLVLQALQSSVEGSSDAILPETPVVNEKLWVDKYAPNSFMELLSDEQTNREVPILFVVLLSTLKFLLN